MWRLLRNLSNAETVQTADTFDVSIREAARLIGCHQSTLSRWAERELIPHLRTPGGHRRFRRSDLEAFVAAHRIGRAS